MYDFVNDIVSQVIILQLFCIDSIIVCHRLNVIMPFIGFVLNHCLSSKKFWKRCNQGFKYQIWGVTDFCSSWVNLADLHATIRTLSNPRL